MNDKKRLGLFGRYFLVALFILLTVITCVGVWNFITEPFVIVVSILLFICNGFCARHFIKLIKKWDKETSEDEE